MSTNKYPTVAEQLIALIESNVSPKTDVVMDSDDCKALVQYIKEIREARDKYRDAVKLLRAEVKQCYKTMGIDGL